MVIQVAINATGETNVAAFTAYFKIEMLIYAPLAALGQTTTVLAAQNVGAKYHWRVHRGVRCCIVFGATFAVVSAAVLLVFRFSVVVLFDQNVEVVAAGGLVMLVSFPFYWIYAFIEVYAGVCRGIGRAKESTLITLLCFVVMRLILLLLVQHCGFGLVGIAAIYPLTWLLAAFFLGFYYYAFAHKELHPATHGGCRERPESFTAKRGGILATGAIARQNPFSGSYRAWQDSPVAHDLRGSCSEKGPSLARCSPGVSFSGALRGILNTWGAYLAKASSFWMHGGDILPRKGVFPVRGSFGNALGRYFARNAAPRLFGNALRRCFIRRVRLRLPEMGLENVSSRNATPRLFGNALRRCFV